MIVSLCINGSKGAFFTGRIVHRRPRVQLPGGQPQAALNPSVLERVDVIEQEYVTRFWPELNQREFARTELLSIPFCGGCHAGEIRKARSSTGRSACVYSTVRCDALWCGDTQVPTRRATGAGQSEYCRC